MSTGYGIGGRLRGLAAVTLLVFGLSGCALVGDDRQQSTAVENREVQAGEVAGLWEGEGGARLTLTERDERFVAVDLEADRPERYGLPVNAKGRVSGEGTWSFGKYVPGYQVRLHFEGPGGLTLTVAELDDKLVLSGYINDGDEFLLYRK